MDGRYRSPFLNIGVTLAVRQSSGNVELDNDLLEMKVRTGAISVAKSFRVRGSMASGPADLFGFRFSSSCSTPGTVTVIFSICGYGLSSMSGKGSVVIGLKADVN